MIDKGGVITIFKEYGIGIHIFVPEHIVTFVWYEMKIDMDLHSYIDYNEQITLKNK
jgi:hypothetical protein